MKQLRGFMHGVNLGGWMSQCDYSPNTLEYFIVEEDFEMIASWGLDHVRLPIDYNVLESGLNVSELGFGYVQRAVSWSKKYCLNIILDLHKTAGFSFDAGEAETGFFESEACQQRFYALWEQFAQRFGGEEHVAFELLNEVTDQAFLPAWKRISREAIRRIRAFAPETKILVGGYWNNSVEAVKDLDTPYDENTVYNFHCYDPLAFTHQHAPWVSHADVSHSMSFEESGADSAYFEERFASAIAKADAENAYLYCGEYGVIDRVAPEEALKWFKSISAVFSAHGIGRAAWSYRKMDFGLSDGRMDGVREELLKYL